MLRDQMLRHPVTAVTLSPCSAGNCALAFVDFFTLRLKMDESMVRYHGSDIQVGDYHIRSGDSQVEGLSGIVSGLRHMLNVSKRLQ